MSFQGADSGERATASISGHGITTGDFNLAIGVRLSAITTWAGLVHIQAGSGLGPSSYWRIATADSGGALIAHHNGGRYCDQNGAGGYVLSTNTNYWVVLSRSGSTIRLRVFNGDSTSTTPLYDDNDADSGSLATYDTLVVGEGVSGEGINGQIWNAKLHSGTEWSNAECITEMQRFGVQKASGNRFAWGLETLNADVFGLNEWASSNALTNSGFSAGTARSTQLEAAIASRVANVGAKTEGASLPGNSTPLTLAYAGPVRVGDLLLVSYFTTDSVTASVTDDQGNAWSAGTVQPMTGDGTQVVTHWAKATTNATPTVSLNWGTATGNVDILLDAFRGFVNPALDKTHGDYHDSASASTTPDSGNTASTSANNELIFGAFGTWSDPTTMTEGSGFTLLQTGHHGGSGNPPRHLTEYKTVSASGAYNATCALGTAQGWCAQVLTFREAPAVSVEQEGSRFRNDDGSETTATWKAAQDTDITAAAGAMRLRMLLNATGDLASKAIGLKYSVNGGQLRSVN